MLSADPPTRMNGSHTTDDCIDDIEHHFSPIPDPRVQIELENLNTSTDLINKLEVELNESRTHFHLLLSDSSQKISEMAKKLGSCVERVKPYYEARVRAKDLRLETQRAALRFERATSSHMAAKEMVRLAEEGLQKDGNVLDPSWQEVLNHSTIRVNDCERERVSEQLHHQNISHQYNNSEQLRVAKAKLNYSKALHRLEEISDEINQKRKIDNLLLLESRGCGVGAESPVSSSPKLTKALRKLSLESGDMAQMSGLPVDWFYRRHTRSGANSERDDTESVATTDTLDDTVIDNLRLTENIDSIDLQFNDVLDSDKTTIL
ncbi:unnamed protein product [Oppiella nova]|uniref:SH3 domain-binding protein 5-like protein n=1 Tax=Oppiella nova TaxID=334625 RepID=A0A7R9LVV3_9ACAR|nr:unnamed protein product [Oppiella nova]CAG2167485.1 unnamed protein product [Oppiella nova]